MRTLSKIIESAKDGQTPTHDECYWAMLALEALQHFDHMDVRNIATALNEGKPSAKMRANMAMEEGFRRFKTALASNPKEWVGWRNDPANPDYQKMRVTTFKVFEKATGVDLRD